MNVQGTLSSPIGALFVVKTQNCGRGRLFLDSPCVSGGMRERDKGSQRAADKQMENKSVVKQENERVKERKQFVCYCGRLAGKSLLSFSKETLCRLSVLQLPYRSLDACF